jgi:hypothetical protein
VLSVAIMSTDNPSIGDEKPPILKKDGGNDNPACHNQRRVTTNVITIIPSLSALREVILT